MKNYKKKGFALTEVLLAVAILIIIGMVAYPLYKKGKNYSDVQNVTNRVVALSELIRKTYAGQPNGAIFNTVQANSATLVRQFARNEGIDENEAILHYSLTTTDSGLWMMFVHDLPMNPETCVGVVKNLTPLTERILLSVNSSIIRVQDNFRNPVVKPTPDIIASGCGNYTKNTNFVAYFAFKN